MTRRGWEAARPYVLIPLLIGALLLLAGRRSGWLGVLAAGGMLAFFRDPDRALDRHPDVLYAAADGLVREVDEVADPAMPGGGATRVSTFLSLHNVHVNRSPVGGTVEGIEEIGGGYYPALFRRSEENRRNRIELRGDRGPVVVVQKAGLIARRISTWVERGEAVEPGGKLGLIHLGSRTDVLFPTGAAEPLVGPGDKVRAGLTPLARYADPPLTLRLALPHFTTCGNLASGFLAILFAASGDFAVAAALVLLAAVLDLLDGAIARNSDSDGKRLAEFGKNLDSLADVVSFGAAPAFAAYVAVLHTLPVAGIAGCLAFFVCGALRLARFPLVGRPDRFVGLPIPPAGLLVAALTVLDTPPLPLLATLAATSVLMVSTVPFPTPAAIFGRKR